jgi:ribosomal protein L34E
MVPFCRSLSFRKVLVRGPSERTLYHLMRKTIAQGAKLKP